ncbi:hypothetical protein H0H92_004333 [Tricholoma furcatifolium]|nr:hypothetical protein H0H92_004333 [Tricholoma furcatifolium]
MNSVYFPAHVVLVLRRIVNVISTLSISNQYILLKQAQADEERAKPLTVKPQTSLQQLERRESPKWNSLRNWDWSRTMGFNNVVNSVDDVVDTIGNRWSWPALLSTFTQVEVPMYPIDPPPPPKPQKDDRRTDIPTRLPPPESTHVPQSPDTIHQLLQNPTLYDPVRTPRYPIVLCHGLYGFDSRGPLKFPSMRMHYWSNVLKVLRDTVKAEVIVTSVPGTGSIIQRAEMLDRQLQHKARGRGINFLAHSMGGLDCRHLITHIKPEIYAPLSLTTVSTPHRGSPFMDWCNENIGIGKFREQERELLKTANENVVASTGDESTTKPKETPFSLSLSSLPSSFTTLLLSIVDSPAYANLTTNYLNEVFNPRTPNDPTVKYFSVAGRMGTASIWHPLWLPKMVLDGVEENHRAKLRALWEKEVSAVEGTPLWAQEREWGNDGLVSIQSARWGEFLGIMEGSDHWEMRGARGIEFGVDLPAIPAIGLGASATGLGLPDWARFVNVWKKEQKVQADVAAAMDAGIVAADVKPVDREEERKLERERDDAVVKSSTARLSAVVDWLTDQMPSPSLSKSQPVEGMQKREDEETSKMKNELATKKDLERFYLALSRKLYDEGL